MIDKAVSSMREHVVEADVLVVTDEDIWLLLLKHLHFLVTTADNVDKAINLYTVSALAVN